MPDVQVMDASPSRSNPESHAIMHIDPWLTVDAPVQSPDTIPFAIVGTVQGTGQGRSKKKK